MKRSFQRGFTAIELIAVVMVILILSGIVLAFFTSGKDEAGALRKTNAAAVLNEAERALAEYNSSTAPGLGKPAVVITDTDPAARTVALKQSGFLGSKIKATDVTVIWTNGNYFWSPTN
ncbi:MAG: type II secretion system GspH family protein [Verrucomicrobia subdivision 3 bacterium]|nr:type II secretion system GspH family protein [Limisphaerales bacterium]